MGTKKNFIYNFLLTGSNLLFPLLTFPYLSRILGADGLGICNFIMSYGQNYTIIAALGIPIYAIREIAKVSDEKKTRSKLFFELLIIHLFFTCFLLIIYFTSVFLYPDFRNYKDLALLGGSLILFNGFSIEWLFTGVNDFKYITIRSLLIRVLSIIAIFLLVKKKEDFFIYFLITVITFFFTVVVNIYYSRKYISRNIVLSIKGILAHIKPIAVLGIYMVLTSIYTVLPTTLLGFLSTKSAVGYYYGADKIIRMGISVFSSLIIVMIPRLNLVVEKKERDEYILLVNKSLIVVTSFGIPITFFVFLIADPLVMLLAGSKFINSILVVQIMAPIILIVAVAQVFVLLILSVNRKDKEMVMLSIAGMTISIIINLIFIPHLAERATGFSQLLSELFITIFSFFLAKKVLNFHFPTRLFLLNVLFVIPFLFLTNICLILTHNDFLKLLYSCLSCGTYFLLYQFFIIKNEFLIGLAKPYITNLKKSF
jgi:O-antigen/teichoic acid export membrane protein